MFDWEKKIINELEMKREKNISELSLNIKKQLELEKKESVLEFIRLLDDPDIKEYLKVKEECDKLESIINTQSDNIFDLKQNICLHHNLLFIKDISDEYNVSPTVNYYMCMCMDCGRIVKLQFINGMRNNTKLFNFGEINDNDLDDMSILFRELKENNLYRDEIIQIIGKKYSKVKKREFMNIEFS